MLSPKPRYDIQNENFDLYTAKELSELTEERKSLLPSFLQYKVFKRGNTLSKKATVKLSFLERMYAFWKGRGKSVYIVIMDEEKGMSIEDFYKLNESLKKKKSNPDNENTNCLVADTTFVLASKELAETFDYINKLCTSPYYNYLLKAKNSPPSKIGTFKKEMNYIVNFLWHYEAIKKKMNIEMGINMPEWLVLSYLYKGDYMKSSTIHNTIFKHCYQSSATKIKMAFSSLQQKGYIVKKGVMSNAMMAITELGKDKVNTIMSKYFVDF